MKFVLLCHGILSLSTTLLAGSPFLKPAAIFSDHMVLQQGVDIPVWGIATPGEEVTVSIQGWESVAIANADGNWTARLGRLQVGGPVTMTIAGRHVLHVIKDVVIGEVWLGDTEPDRKQTESEEGLLANLPQLRIFYRKSPLPQPDAEEPTGEWLVCSPDTVQGFPPLHYLFGRKMFIELRVPVGIVVQRSSASVSPPESKRSSENAFAIRGIIRSDSRPDVPGTKAAMFQLQEVVERLTRSALREFHSLTPH